ncbi:MAG TPA: hypothetical protein VGM94_02130 [Galbitalea sp.]|jgi:hypothetical protein
MSKLASTLHDATHHVPEVPEHQDRPHGHQGQALQNRSAQNRSLQNLDATLNLTARVRHNKSPRLLVGWHNWIASLFTGKTEWLERARLATRPGWVTASVGVGY